MQKKLPQKNKRLALTKTAPHKNPCHGLPSGKPPTPTTKKTATHGTRTFCKKNYRKKINGLHLRKPPRTKNPVMTTCPGNPLPPRQKKPPCTAPIPLAKKNTAKNCTACTYANRPERKPRPRIFYMA